MSVCVCSSLSLGSLVISARKPEPKEAAAAATKKKITQRKVEEIKRKKEEKKPPDSVPVAVNKNIMMTENNDASWHAWTDNDDDDDDEDDPGPCQVQLFIAQGRCQTLRLAVQPPSYPSTAPSADKCASFSQLNAESD